MCPDLIEEGCSAGKRDILHLIPTASFKTLSPKTMLYSNGGTSSSEKTLNVATGSVAEIRAPGQQIRFKEDVFKPNHAYFPGCIALKGVPQSN